ncbi:acetate--CoA ligase family protein [Phytohabitans sp. ZYX-F-186]|uniref:Acetate--CoA ligase family protein n=1 Tax=Phytohabitans maris TaxID=3071409 RepID=A0ABU0ZMF9_9ACTN|nr:acetate--CoA ligase family protein [Phytohabitans sp. ZYX-F-186]MDQ7907460.1 acetate--CoA ligase family protein [Phytohabitans sp. ZYX-F-186]
MATLEYDKRRALVTPGRLRHLFGARRLAVVGASSTSSWARNLVRSLNAAGGLKELVFVHPKYPELFGQATVPNLRDLEEPIDLAFLMVGPSRVDEIIEDAAAAGIRNAVVLAAGYGETGQDGRARQLALAEHARRLDVTVMGPNTIGFINATAGIAPWAVATERPPLKGTVSAVFESGSMARATHEFAQAHGVGASLWASVGNSAVLTSLDVLEYLLEDEPTRAVALFLETVGEPDRLLALGRRALELDKPIVAFKAGRTEAGQRSAMAHTGAVATDDAVVDALFRQAGIVRAESLEELVSTVGLFGHYPERPKGRRMGVVTSSGGGCNIIADLAAANGLDLPEWERSTVDALAEHLPPFASILNPLDTTGFGHARARPRPTKAEDDLMEIAVKDSGIDFMFTMMTPLPSSRPEDPAFIESRLEILGQIVRDAPVPLFLASNTCLDLPDYPRGLLAGAGLHLLPGADLALKSLGHLMRWVDLRASVLADEPPARVSPDGGSGPALTGTWAEDEGRDLLTAHGVPMAPAVLVTDRRDAARLVAEWDGPVAMKVCSREIAHKSDIGGVILGVGSPPAAEAAFDRILAAAATHVPEATVRGVLVSPMRTGGLEMLIGVTSDPTFGAVLAVGLGGIWVEVFKDVSLRVLPVCPGTVKEMLLELKAAPLLRGVRGVAPVDLDALTDVIMAVSRAALALGDRLETLEVNPLRVDGAVVEGLDALVVTGDRA